MFQIRFCSFRRRIVLIKMIFLFFATNFFFTFNSCQKDIVTEYSDSDKNALLNSDEIKKTTFVELSYDKFPQLPNISLNKSGVIYVSTNGNDKTGNGSLELPFRTISKALSISVSGDTIAVSGGTYHEIYTDGDYRAVVIDKSNITLTSVENEIVKISPISKDVTYGIVVRSSGVVLNGLTIENFDQGILFDDKRINNSVISNCNISDVSEGIATWNGEVNGLLVFNTNITNASLIGVHCGEGRGENWRIENCSIKMSGNNEGSGADCFAIEHGDNILLINCDFTGASADGIDTKSSRVVIINTIVHDVGRNGIKLWHGGDIVNCLVHHTGADASIVVESGPKVRLLNSTICYHNYETGTSYNITFGYDSNKKIDIELINCIIFNTSGGIYINERSIISINNSLFYNMENGKILEQGDLSVWLSQGSQGLIDFGVGNIIAYPELNVNFRPNPGSPVINAGKILEKYFPGFDILANNRIKNGLPDLGPYEDY